MIIQAELRRKQSEYEGEACSVDNAALTSYGLLHREDYQPMQTPVQERFEMDTQQLT